MRKPRPYRVIMAIEFTVNAYGPYDAVKEATQELLAMSKEDIIEGLAPHEGITPFVVKETVSGTKS